MTFPARLTELLEKNKQGDIADGLKLSSFLFNHAEAIRDLVVAAEKAAAMQIAEQWELQEALAKLEES